jgi:hypothetical protein
VFCCLEATGDAARDTGGVGAVEHVPDKKAATIEIEELDG